MDSSNAQQAISNRRRASERRGKALSRTVACCLSLVAVFGCESLQRKFTRKPSNLKPVTPIIQFHDYAQAVTPLDRYRKHTLLFEYWNSTLLDALQSKAFNAKRAKKASSESLQELQTLKGLLQDDIAGKMAPLIAEREQIHQQIHTGRVTPSQASGVIRRLETQARALHRDFHWNDIQDHLVEQKPEPQKTAEASSGSP